jgi:AcrR family transcriptional regulator
MTSSDTSPFNRTVQHDAKRAAILGQAAKLFNTRGSRATTLLDIAQELGLTKTSLYYYVKTKEDLIYQCYQASCDTILADLKHISAKPISGLEKVVTNIRHHFRYNHEVRIGKRPHSAVLLEIASLREDHRNTIESRYVELFKHVREFLREGIADGSIDTRCEPNATTIALMGTQEWMFNWQYKTAIKDIVALTEATCDLIRHGLSNSTTRHEPSPLPPREESRIDHGFDRDQQNRLKQEAFYKTGTRFFNIKGFKGTSLDEIAETLNVTKGAFYYHIKNKDDLLLECYKRSMAIGDTILEEASQEPTGLLRIERHCRQSFVVQNSDQGPLIRYTSVVSLPVEQRRQVMEQTDRSNAQLGRFIAEGIADRSIRDTNVMVAQELLAGAVNASMELDKWRSLDDLNQASIDYFSLLINGLAPRP